MPWTDLVPSALQDNNNNNNNNNNNLARKTQEQTLAMDNDNSVLQKRRLLYSFLGREVTEAFLTSIQKLEDADPKLGPHAQAMRQALIVFTNKALETFSASSHIDMAAVLQEFEKPEPPSVNLHRATYGVPGGGERDRADVGWLLEPLIFDSVLRLPETYSLHSLFGSKPGSDRGQHNYTLEIQADTSHGPVTLSVAAPDGRLAEDVVVSSAQPSHPLPSCPSDQEFKDMISQLLKGKKGLEIGGPSDPFKQKGIYNVSIGVDMANFAEQTLWGSFKNGSTFNYGEGHGSGTVYIADGSTLDGIPAPSTISQWAPIILSISLTHSNPLTPCCVSLNPEVTLF